MVVVQHIPTYIETLMPRKHNFSIKTATGYAFGRTREYEDIPNINYTRLDQLAALSVVSSIDNGTAVSGYFPLKAIIEGEDYFYEYEGDKILQAFIGIFPSPARLFRQIPAPVPRGNLSRIKAPATPTINSIGYIDGTLAGSPYNMPSSLSEMLLPKYMNVAFQVFNPLAITMNPVLRIAIRRHSVKWFNPANSNDKAIIDKMISGAIPVKMWSPGMEPMQYDIQGNLGIEPIPIQYVEG
jgi:hypothetical protein